MPFWNDAEADQGFARGDLLPTKPSDGAPPKALYLFRAAEAEVRYSESEKNPGVPYLNVRAEVVEPSDFTGASIFPTLWLTPKPADQKQEQGNKRTRGALRTIIGDTEYARITSQASTFEELIQGFADVLDDVKPQFVGQVGVEKAKKDSGYDDRNRINYYYPAETWGSVGGQEAEADLPF